MSKDFNEQWQQLEAFLEERFEKTPDTQAILYLIGINEYQGRIPKIKFSKEQKQELMHVGLCTLLCIDDYYALSHYDDEGWPHFVAIKNVDAKEFESQDLLIKKLMLKYFNFD